MNECIFHDPIRGTKKFIIRAGEMIRGVGGLGLGALEEKGPQVFQRAQNHLYNYCSC